MLSNLKQFKRRFKYIKLIVSSDARVGRIDEIVRKNAASNAKKGNEQNWESFHIWKTRSLESVFESDTTNELVS